MRKKENKMDLGLKNAEGYYDLKAYEAIKNMSKHEERKFKNIVYICSPLSGDVKRNQNKACGYSRFVVSKGYIPIAIHLMFPQFIDDDNKDDRSKAINMGLEILSRCDELWCFGKNMSEGMLKELEFAKKYMIKIRYFTDCCDVLPKKEVV